MADFATIDRILKDQAGFRLGPFELLDLTALDVSHPVMESIYRQYYDEPRFRPSVITAQRLAAGVLGRKTGEGFYRYVDGAAQVPPEPPAPVVDALPPVWVSPRAARRPELLPLLQDLGAKIETGATPSPHALILVAPLGFDVTTVAAVERLDATRTVGIDMLVDDAATKRRVLATNPATRARHARRGARPVRARRQGGERDPRLRRLRHAARGRRPSSTSPPTCASSASASPADLETAVTPGPGLSAGPAGHGRPLRARPTCWRCCSTCRRCMATRAIARAPGCAAAARSA